MFDDDQPISLRLRAKPAEPPPEPPETPVEPPGDEDASAKATSEAPQDNTWIWMLGVFSLPVCALLLVAGGISPGVAAVMSVGGAAGVVAWLYERQDKHRAEARRDAMLASLSPKKQRKYLKREAKRKAAERWRTQEEKRRLTGWKVVKYILTALFIWYVVIPFFIGAGAAAACVSFLNGLSG